MHHSECEGGGIGLSQDCQTTTTAVTSQSNQLTAQPDKMCCSNKANEYLPQLSGPRWHSQCTPNVYKYIQCTVSMFIHYTTRLAAANITACSTSFCLDGMISTEEPDQQKPLRGAAAFISWGFTGGDKEMLLLSSIIYVVDCNTFLDAIWLRGSWRHVNWIYGISRSWK